MPKRGKKGKKQQFVIPRISREPRNRHSEPCFLLSLPKNLKLLNHRRRGPPSPTGEYFLLLPIRLFPLPSLNVYRDYARKPAYYRRKNKVRNNGKRTEPAAPEQRERRVYESRPQQPRKRALNQALFRPQREKTTYK